MTWCCFSTASSFAVAKADRQASCTHVLRNFEVAQLCKARCSCEQRDPRHLYVGACVTGGLPHAYRHRDASRFAISASSIGESVDLKKGRAARIPHSGHAERDLGAGIESWSVARRGNHRGCTRLHPPATSDLNALHAAPRCNCVHACSAVHHRCSTDLLLSTSVKKRDQAR